MNLRPGERLLLKRALQTHAASMLATKAKIIRDDKWGDRSRVSAIREIDETVAACDALAERLLKEHDDNIERRTA